ncbi:zinc finger protein OZF-like [Penaeus indicus]|uniref:zinc finger protein OZF-like n=1 Tax=Penaeus indicus TaxID=29960 RepID=UPI00300DB1BE
MDDFDVDMKIHDNTMEFIAVKEEGTEENGKDEYQNVKEEFIDGSEEDTTIYIKTEDGTLVSKEVRSLSEEAFENDSVEDCDEENTICIKTEDENLEGETVGHFEDGNAIFIMEEEEDAKDENSVSEKLKGSDEEAAEIYPDIYMSDDEDPLSLKSEDHVNTCSSGGQRVRSLKNEAKGKHSCDICGKRFPIMSRLLRHMRIHKKEKPDNSEVCKQVSNENGFSKYTDTCTSDGPFICDVCNKSFTLKDDIVMHMRIHRKEKPYVCDVCNKVISGKSGLEKHMRVHTKEKPYSCEVCSKTFSQKPHLESHKTTHLKVKPFNCEVCQKPFSCKSSIRKHMRLHSDKKPFNCEVCKKAFTVNYHLVDHMRVHSEEKPFSCDMCTKAFARKDDLARHMRIHTHGKPHNCSVCSKSFTRKHSLRVHMRLHTKEKPYSCATCSKAFSEKRKLAKHLEVHAKERAL